ncbi:putative Histone acetyltransferase [Rhodotorula taiwanensis]|uniref:Histone acetyltransferase type B catalytic subunit n=1 Tax=Rhodotorula taiwanensis TaxID=741276 RepID=A0A2S5B0C8_9BASI|nr:putative Histone acetyltransferase [Rhodotorula taiwanensis]
MTEDWSASGVEALRLRLARTKAQEEQLESQEHALVEPFSPIFVYPIYGEEETIFGYKGLDIDYRFASGSLAQYLGVTYEDKFPETANVKADDPEKILYEFIPPDYTKSLEAFTETVEKDGTSFRPLGERVGAYRIKERGQNGKGKGKGKSRAGPILPDRGWELLDLDAADDEDGVRFEGYWTNWDTPGFKEYHRRMQIFALLYIEGASYIDEEDGRWEFVTLFERRKKGDEVSYHFVGYVSFYSFFCWPDTKRLRLAQFVILPLYHKRGHGSALYTLCYRNILSRPEISELTADILSIVEDPSEAFEDMRDKCDLYTLLSENALEGIKAPLDRSWTERIRLKYKLADRQFYRLAEMLLLLTIDPDDEVQQRAIRLTVKKRLFLFNKEQLMQIEDKDERKAKLQETFESVRADYERLTEKFVEA